MKGSVVARPAGRWEVESAEAGDDAGIRELLRGRAMGGRIRLTLEREPSAWLAAAVEGDRHYSVVARERESGRVVGMGSRAVRSVWVDGERAKMGYLAQLRLAPGVTAGRRLLAAGYQACERRRRGDELPYDLTSVVADNAPARRLLERGLPGLPRYRRLCGVLTLTIPTGRRNDRNLGRRSRLRRGSDGTLPAIVACLERNLRRYQFAPAWTEDDLRSPERTRGLDAGDFLVAIDGSAPDRVAPDRIAPDRVAPDRVAPDRVAGCVAVWDQRGFKQVVVRGYTPALARFRPLVNVLLSIGGRPRLPPPGRTLELAYLSHLAVDGDRADVAVELIRAARREAAGRGLDYLTLSLAEANSMLGNLRRAFPARELRSVLYLVQPGDVGLPRLGDGCPHVEAAIL